MELKSTEESQVGSPQWWSSRPQRADKSGGRGRPTLPFERIIAAALEAVDEVGPQTFSMRMLAERLGSGTATLYRHFASKDEILAYVIDHVLGEMDGFAPLALAGSSQPWQQAITLAAARLYRLLGTHPNIVPLMVSQIPLGPNGLMMRERGLSLLMGNGFSPGLATRAYVTIGHYVLGFAIQQHAAAFWEDTHTRVALAGFFKGLDPKAYPSTRRTAEHLSSLPNDEEFHFGLKLIVDGLERARQAEAAQGEAMKTSTGVA